MGDIQQTIFDNYGKLLLGGQLEFYENNTGNPKDTWADAGHVTLNENPLPVNPNGRVNVYLGEGLYRVVVRDLNGFIIDDRPDVVGSDLGLSLAMTTDIGTLRGIQGGSVGHVLVSTYSSAEDAAMGGGGLFKFITTNSPPADDGGTRILPDGSSPPGYYQRVYHGSYMASWWGAGLGLGNDADRLANAAASIITINDAGGNLFYEDADYSLSSVLIYPALLKHEFSRLAVLKATSDPVSVSFGDQVKATKDLHFFEGVTANFVPPQTAYAEWFAQPSTLGDQDEGLTRFINCGASLFKSDADWYQVSVAFDVPSLTLVRTIFLSELRTPDTTVVFEPAYALEQLVMRLQDLYVNGALYGDIHGQLAVLADYFLVACPAEFDQAVSMLSAFVTHNIEIGEDLYADRDAFFSRYVLFYDRAQFRNKNGSDKTQVSGTYLNITSRVANTSSVETTLWTTTMLGNTLKDAGDRLVISCAAKFSAFAVARTLNLYFGGTVIGTLTSSLAGDTDAFIEATITRSNTGTNKYHSDVRAELRAAGSVSVDARYLSVDVTLDLTADQIIKLTGNATGVTGVTHATSQLKLYPINA